MQKIVLSQTNCFLIQGESGCLLVDCGCSGDGPALLSALVRLGLPRRTSAASS